jgi:hypothetical protein
MRSCALKSLSCIVLRDVLSFPVLSFCIVITRFTVYFKAGPSLFSGSQIPCLPLKRRHARKISRSERGIEYFHYKTRLRIGLYFAMYFLIYSSQVFFYLLSSILGFLFCRRLSPSCYNILPDPYNLKVAHSAFTLLNWG